MAELPKPPSLDLDSEGLEPISGDTGEVALASQAEPIAVPVQSSTAIPSRPEDANPAETTLDNLEPIDLNESGPVDLSAETELLPRKLPPAPSVPTRAPEQTSDAEAYKPVPLPGDPEDLPADALPQSPYKPVPIPENPDLPREVPPPTITGGESSFEIGQPAVPAPIRAAVANQSPQSRVARPNQRPEGPNASALDVHDQTDEVPSALLNPTSVVSGASAAATPPPSPGLMEAPDLEALELDTPPVATQTAPPPKAFGDTVIDVDNPLPTQALADASPRELGGATDEVVRSVHHEVTAKHDEGLSETIDEVLHQSTEQALRLANVVDDVERVGATVSDLRTQMSAALNDINVSIQGIQARQAAQPVTVGGQGVPSEVEVLKSDFNNRLDALEIETAQKLKRYGMFQLIQVVLLVAVLGAVVWMMMRTPEPGPRSGTPPAVAKEKLSPLDKIADVPKTEAPAVVGEPPATPKGREVPVVAEEKKPSKKKRRRRRRRE